MNISIQYSPATLADFLAALEAAKGMPTTVSLPAQSPSAANSPLVAAYVASAGQTKYKRRNGSSLSPEDDIRARAADGDPHALSALATLEMPEDTPPETAPAEYEGF